MKITKNKHIRRGKFIFEGTRITVEDIVYSLLEGLTADEIIKEYPSVKTEFFDTFLELVKSILKENQSLDAYRYFLSLSTYSFWERNIIESKEFKKHLKEFLKYLKKKEKRNEIFVR